MLNFVGKVRNISQCGNIAASIQQVSVKNNNIRCFLETVQFVISDIISSKRLQSLVPMDLLMNTYFLCCINAGRVGAIKFML